MFFSVHSLIFESFFANVTAVFFSLWVHEKGPHFHLILDILTFLKCKHKNRYFDFFFLTKNMMNFLFSFFSSVDLYSFVRFDEVSNVAVIGSEPRNLISNSKLIQFVESAKTRSFNILCKIRLTEELPILFLWPDFFFFLLKWKVYVSKLYINPVERKRTVKCNKNNLIFPDGTSCNRSSSKLSACCQNIIIQQQN